MYVVGVAKCQLIDQLYECLDLILAQVDLLEGVNQALEVGSRVYLPAFDDVLDLVGHVPGQRPLVDLMLEQLLQQDVVPS